MKFGKDVAAGMRHLHSEGILHCYLAARNLLVGFSKEEIRIKVADFGLAQHLSSNYQEYFKLDEELLIPVRWTAVEVLRTRKVTQKSDVWSFGVTMYEILDGALPYYQIQSTKEATEQILKGLKLEKPTKIVPSDELWAIIESCWLEPSQRPSFQEIHQQLSFLLSQISKPSEGNEFPQGNKSSRGSGLPSEYLTFNESETTWNSSMHQ